MSVRFLHTADLHLGLRLTRFPEPVANRIAEARFIALEHLREAAVKHAAQFIVIAGDLFDDNAVSADLATRAFSFLESKQWPGPVYIIPGNHDPLTPGCVWDRDPWTRAQPHLRVNLLRGNEPVAVPGLLVRLFPCPCRHRTAIDDPTGWIADHPRGDDEIRIGIAHGSLQIMPNLPEDDHPIAANAAERLDLDYLALGHWHKPLRHSAGRTVYPGTHEPMRFPGETAGASIGWEPHGSGGDDDRFADNGRGTALLVEIAGPNAVPKFTDIDVGRLQWRAERVDVTGRGFGELFRMFDEQPDYDRVVLRLTLAGVADPRLHKRLHELGKIIVDRYHLGSSFDAEAVLVEPDPTELRSAVGDGVLARVLDRLQAIDQRDDVVARYALKLLYSLAWEDRPQ